MGRNCCECSAEPVLYSDARLRLGHAWKRQMCPFTGANFLTCVSRRKAPDLRTFGALADIFKSRANMGFTGTLVAKGKALQSALWKRRTKDYRTQPADDHSSSHVEAGSLSGCLGSSLFSLYRLPALKSIRVLCPDNFSSNRARVFRRRRS